MLTLCIDTAYKYLTCALIDNDKVITSVSYECFKRQSEEIFVALDKVFKDANISKNSINAICISEGPGSYTGVRIAMSLAKTIAEVLPCELYTISTLQLYAGNNPKTMVIMNARADRAYVGVYDVDKTLEEDNVKALTEIETKDFSLVGDCSLIGGQDYYSNIPECFLKTRKSWKKIDNIAYLVPKYLKESESYLK